MTYTTIEKLWGYLLIAPFIVFFIIFVLVPYGMVIWLSFVDWHPRGVTEYIGLQNYIAVISTDVARKAMFNSFYFALLVVPISTALSLVTAMLIVSLRNRSLRSFFQATFYLPGVISGLSVAIIWRFVFDYHVGILNFFLSLLGVEAVNWLGNIYTALPSLAGMAILSGNGVAIIIFCAALLSVPADLYHAAAVDGANFWRQQWSITLPLITSFKAPQDVATVPPSLVLTRPAVTNYIDLIRGTGVANAPVVRWFLNSVLTSIAATTGVVLLASLAGYSFARKQFPFRDQIFWLIIATILVPGWSTIIATYVLTLNLGMHDTYWALILPGLASPFAVFLFRQFAVTLPEELFQAARIDGAGELQLWWLIALPMSRPVLATLAIFTFVAHWNDFLWPLLVLNKQNLYTLPVGVSVIMYQIQGAGPSYGIGMAAAILMSVLPIFAFILMQRQMIEGITIGSLKG